MKKFSLLALTLVLSLVLFYSCSSSKSDSDQTTWKHFRVDLSFSESKYVKKLQEDVGIEPPLSNIRICVNLTVKGKEYLTVGDDTDPTGMNFAWSQISKEVQDFLLSYKGESKINLDKK